MRRPRSQPAISRASSSITRAGAAIAIAIDTVTGGAIIGAAAATPDAGAVHGAGLSVAAARLKLARRLRRPFHRLRVPGRSFSFTDLAVPEGGGSTARNQALPDRLSLEHAASGSWCGAGIDQDRASIEHPGGLSRRCGAAGRGALGRDTAARN